MTFTSSWGQVRVDGVVAWRIWRSEISGGKEERVGREVAMVEGEMIKRERDKKNGLKMVFRFEIPNI